MKAESRKNSTAQWGLQGGATSIGGMVKVDKGLLKPHGLFLPMPLRSFFKGSKVTSFCLTQTDIQKSFREPFAALQVSLFSISLGLICNAPALLAQRETPVGHLSHSKLKAEIGTTKLLTFCFSYRQCSFWHLNEIDPNVGKQFSG